MTIGDAGGPESSLDHLPPFPTAILIELLRRCVIPRKRWQATSIHSDSVNALVNPQHASFELS